jgi:uncharacterized protein (UPF0332 family)
LTNPNPDHLLEQADRLAARGHAGQPRQADLRRAVSTAYYAVFHAVAAAAADQYVGVTKRSTSQYTLVYRSVDHRVLRDLCASITKRQVPQKLARHVPATGFGPDMESFATNALELQRMRHEADYDPSIRIKTSDAVLAVSSARSALIHLTQASAPSREAFFSLLLFQPR